MIAQGSGIALGTAATRAAPGYDDHLTTSYPRTLIAACRRNVRVAEAFGVHQCSSKWNAALAVLVAVSIRSGASHAETPEEWIKLGARVHGAFLPAGIRIGLDALERLKARPRGVTVIFYSGEKSPCPCIADGVMLATQASPGQGTCRWPLTRHRPACLRRWSCATATAGSACVTASPTSGCPRLSGGTRTSIPPGDWAAMSAPGLFEVRPAP
jgi:hypothetical protein